MLRNNSLHTIAILNRYLVVDEFTKYYYSSGYYYPRHLIHELLSRGPFPVFSTGCICYVIYVNVICVDRKFIYLKRGPPIVVAPRQNRVGQNRHSIGACSPVKQIKIRSSSKHWCRLVTSQVKPAINIKTTSMYKNFQWLSRTSAIFNAIFKQWAFIMITKKYTWRHLTHYTQYLY